MEYDSFVYAVAASLAFDKKVRMGIELIRHFSTFEDIFRLKVSDWEDILNGPNRIIDIITDPALLEKARKEVDYNLSNGIDIIPYTESKYPIRFKECDDASLVLYHRGTSDLNEKRTLGVVGTRRSTFYGKSTCQSLIEALSELTPHPVIVSGLAYGIDECAHISAMGIGLNTIAVIPSCIGRIYPSGHRRLAQKIEKCGGILSDRPSTTETGIIEQGCFHRRNRIIAGISDAVLLAESFIKGGGLITTSFAESYNREIFAVPGRIGDASFEGCNNLIATNKASIVTNGNTIPESMGWASHRKTHSIEPTLFDNIQDPLKHTIVKALSKEDTMTASEISVKTGYTISKLATALLELEIDGIIRCAESNKYAIRKNI